MIVFNKLRFCNHNCVCVLQVVPLMFSESLWRRKIVLVISNGTLNFK